MSANRLLTTAVQLMLLGGVIVCIRLMWADLKNDVIETIKDFRK
jgi:hypothetical protein